MPSLDSRIAFRLAPVIMSRGEAFVSAFWTCDSLKLWINANPASVSSFRTCFPCCGPLGTIAGFDPRKPGVPLVRIFLIEEKLKEMWCPSNLHPQAFLSSGFTKIEKYYFPLFLYSSSGWFSRTFKTFSSSIISIVFAKPFGLRHDFNKSSARVFCSSLSSRRAIPFRLFWNVVPVKPFFVIQRKHGLRLLLTGETWQKTVGQGSRLARLCTKDCTDV